MNCYSLNIKSMSSKSVVGAARSELLRYHSFGSRVVWQLFRVDRINGVHHGRVCCGTFFYLVTHEDPRNFLLERAELSAAVTNSIARVVCVNNAVLASPKTLVKEHVQVTGEECTLQGVTCDNALSTDVIVRIVLDIDPTLFPQPVLSRNTFSAEIFISLQIVPDAGITLHIERV